MTDTRTGEVTGPAGQWPVMAQLPVLDRFLPGRRGGGRRAAG